MTIYKFLIGIFLVLALVACGGGSTASSAVDGLGAPASVVAVTPV